MMGLSRYQSDNHISGFETGGRALRGMSDSGLFIVIKCHNIHSESTILA